MISVLIAEDQSMVRAGFRALIEAESDLTVAGEAANGREAVELALGRRPDVVLMDIRMPGMDGLEAARRISAAPSLAATRILVLTTFELDEYVFGALRAGASGFLLKRSTPEDLLRAIHVVALGDALLSPAVTRRVIERVIEQPILNSSPEPWLADLTPRELEVFLLIAQGRSNREIAAALTVEETTVKSHVRNVLTKLSARDRIHAVILAYECGAIAPGTRTAP